MTVSNVYDMTEPGTYTISVTGGVVNSSYQQTSNSITVTVHSAARGDLNGDGVMDLDDIAMIQAALNTRSNRTPTNAVNDARDLNGDGIINAEDARILTTLCTYPRCVSHP